MKTNKKLWKNFSYSFKEHSIITNDLISKAVSAFWSEHVNYVTSDNHVICLFRIKNSKDVIRTLGYLQKLSLSDMEFFTKYVQNILYIKSDEYKTDIFKEIIISFGIRNGELSKHPMAMDTVKDDSPVQYQYYQHYKLPITFDPLKYGSVISTEGNKYYVQVTPLTLAIINHNSEQNKVDIYKDGNLILQYTDTLNSNETFIRELGANTYHYTSDGEIQLLKVSKATRFIKKTKASRTFNEKFLTLDIETRVINNVHKPYLISFYDGKESLSFFLSDYSSEDEMFEDAILSLCRAKYHRHKIYIHNLANFDGIFLLKYLAKIGRIKPLINNGRIIQFQLEYFEPNRDYSIILDFRDSYQILLSSLKRLSKSFDTQTQKSIFPYRFANNHNLDYDGKIPALRYFDDLSIEEYNSYSSNFSHNWNLREEAIKYCVNDCIALYQVIEKFNQLLFDEFSININEHPTISSHARRVFCTHFLEENTIPMIYGEDYRKLKLSYTGGATDMYIPFNDRQAGELIYAYDVNSLYPYIMANFPMPVGKKVYFEGDIRKVNPEAFGFFYCKIEAPQDLMHPILQTHVNTKSGLRTVAALGTYHDMVFSHSMDNVLKLGYKFEILWGYMFDKKIIFKEYVEKLYHIRLTYPKNHPMNQIAKILLNSLYGVFGMRDDFDIIKIMCSKEFDSLMKCDQRLVTEIIQLGEQFLVQYKNRQKSLMPEELIGKDYNINVAIASAITSYSRDYMSQFKNKPTEDMKLFYSDTDSIYTNLSPDKMNKLFPGIVNSTELGKLKLETVSNKAIFLAPKCYALETIDGSFIYKVKGLTKDVALSLSDFESLLNKDSVLVKDQTKWYKSLSEGIISVLEQSYTLRQTDNKRELLFDNNNMLIATKPYHIDEKKELL